MSPRLRFTLAVVIALTPSGVDAHSPGTLRHSPIAVRPPGIQVQLSGRMSRETAPLHAIPAAPLRKAETAPPPSVPSELFSNPLKRHRMAMPSIPAGDSMEYAF